MRLTRDFYENVEIPAYVLCKANGERIGEIQCVSKKTLSINEMNEISFDTYKYIDGVENELYDLISEMKYVLLPGMFKFVITSVDENDDGVNPVKEVTAKSIESNMDQRYLEQFYINNGEDYAINNVKLYDPTDKNHSLLNLVLDEKCPDWSVGYVDPAIVNSQRFFEVERTGIYTFLTNDLANAFNAVVTFNSWNMTVNVYKEENFGEDSNVYLTYDNLMQNASLSSSVDDVKTCMTVIGAEDLNLREVNMGSDRIYMFDYYATPEFMSQELCDAYALWKGKMAVNRVRYGECVNETLELYDEINYLTNEKMPSYGDNKLVLAGGDPVTINGVTFTVDPYAQTVVLNGTATDEIEYVLSDSLNEVLENDTSYHFNGCPVQPNSETFPTPHLQDYYVLWYNPNDPASKEEPTAIDKGYGNEKVYETGYDKISIIVKSGTVLEDVTFVPAVYKPESECRDWEKYGLNPLKEKLAEYEGKQAVMAKAGWGDESSPNYQTQYLPVYNTIQEINAQIVIVETELAELNAELDSVHAEMSVIATNVAMKTNFTDEQIIELSKFVREETVNSDNYVITDSMTDAERVKMLEDMLEYGETELRKVSQPQIQFSISLLNLFNMKEFDDLSPDFERGNYVHVILRDDYVVKARLLSMEIDFYNMNDLSVTFGNTNKTKGKTLFTDITKAINTATSASTTVSVKASYWNAANQDVNEVNDMLADGLVAAGQEISTSSADVTINDNGILLKSTDPEYPLDRILIGGSRILFSDDDFKTVSEAIGRCKYWRDGVLHDEFGVIAKFVIAGYINGTEIEAATIKGSSIEIAGGKWDANGLILPPGTTVSWQDVEDAPTIPTKTSQLQNDSNYQTPQTIKETVITKDYIESLNVRAGSVVAENIIGDEFEGKSMMLIQDSENTESDHVIGFALTARHVLGESFDYAQTQISSRGGVIISSRKNANTPSTPSTQNDYLFNNVNFGVINQQNNPSLFYVLQRDGYIEKQYEYVDDPNDDFDDRRRKHQEELTHIVYTSDSRPTCKLTYGGIFYTYDGDDYSSVGGDKIKVHKNDKDAYACLSKNQTIHEYGSSEITTGQAVTVYIDSDLLAMSDVTNGYQVFITNTSSNLTTYVEKNADSFVVHGANGATFDYQVVMKQA